jgi:SpoVK/Ycf46/Vps4 family AAA+-type ATPase
MEVEPLVGEGATSGGKLHLNELIYPDYELHSSFTASEKNKKKYEEDPARVDRVSVAIRLQQMRAHLTRAVLPDFYSKENKGSEYEKAYSAILYGPHGTGKTTLAEALAATAKVPLVRLSPSDLMVQGTDVIESRARAIFDSLSMLTQVVIFLDEFEPVVRTRETDKKLKGSPQDPPEFRFLVTGMLPKLIKLNKSAEKQSVVYCLATNYLTQLDKAAKRIGRFDLQIPIYHPDPMSRIGVFLYRLITILQKEKEGKWNETLEELTANPSFWSRTHEAIVKTREVSAQSLATIFFSPEAKKSFLTYVRDESPGALPPVPTPEKSSEKGKTTVEEDIEAQRLSYEESWRERLLPGASNALPPS